MNYSRVDIDNLEKPTESFEALLNELASATPKEGSVVSGTIIAIDRECATIDVGLKSEGKIPLREFGSSAVVAELKVGDKVDVYVNRIDGPGGLVDLSREKARREAAWNELEKSHAKGDKVNGVIFGRVKGGFTVDLSGAVAFLPGSQVDVRPIKDIEPLMDIEQPFLILKMDRARGNIVVSRRAVLEESQAEVRSEILSKIEEGTVLEGIIKNITDYGAFVDLGGFDGLLHVTDISWQRINHPSDALNVGDKVKVQVIKFNKDNHRISLGMKQLHEDPWKNVGGDFAEGTRHKGRVTNITDYGAFVELRPGIEGLVHMSEISWTKKNVHPNKLLSVDQEVELLVLESEPEKRRIALGIKQCQDNPWDALQTQFPINSDFEGEIRNITEFGLFVAMNDDIDGMVHMSDLSWEKSGEEAIKEYAQGQKIKVKVLDIDPERERVVLGVKQLTADKFADNTKDLKKNQVVTVEITDVVDGELRVQVAEDVPGVIRRTELARDRNDRRADRYAVGEKIDAMIVNVDKRARKVMLSIKSREIQEEKEAVEKYGSTDSGASLGSILSAALEQADAKAESKKAEKPAKAEKKADKAEKKTDDASSEEKPKKAPAKKKAAAKKDEAPAESSDA